MFPMGSHCEPELFPLLGGAVALATVARRSIAADPSASFGKPSPAKARFVYVGTYTFPGTAPGGTHQSQALGIYLFRMNPSDGGLTPLRLQPLIMAPNPSYLALDPGLRHLYSVNEMTDGGVSAYVTADHRSVANAVSRGPQQADA